MDWTDFLHAGANFGKLKFISLIFKWALDQRRTLYVWLLNTNLPQLYLLDPRQ